MSAPLLKLPIPVALWRLAWPLIAIGLLKTGMYLLDAYWIGSLGDRELTAIGGAAFAWWILWIIAELGAHGVQSKVSHCVGAGSTQHIATWFSQGLYLALGASALTAAVAWPLIGPYFNLLGLSDAHTVQAGQEFLSATLIGQSAFAVHATLVAVFRGVGHTRTALLITATSLLCNALLDPVLMFGWGVPAMGISGAAWATTLSNVIGIALGLWMVGRIGHRPRWERPAMKLLAPLWHIGMPVSARGIAFCLVYIALGPIITAFGAVQMAALGVGMRVEGLAYQFSVGLSSAVATLIGQQLGAGQRDHIVRTARIATVMGGSVLIAIGVVSWFIAPQLIGWFANEPETVAAGVSYLRIQCIIFLWLTMESVYEGAFIGIGRTRPTFWVGALGTAARIPLAVVLAFWLGLGIEGVWVSIALSTVVKGTALWFWFERASAHVGLIDASPLPHEASP